MQENEARQRRRRAYASGARIARERLAVDAPADAEALAAIEASDVLVVGGCYDHVEQVLEALEVPYTPVAGAHLERIRLRPEQLLVVNCPGEMSRTAIAGINSFVDGGGSLFTTDWALRHVLEPAFPGVLAYNGHPTQDDVVRIDVKAHDNPFLIGVMDERDDPLWWLEGSSYPIRILDPERVEILIDSAELGKKYGESPVAVLFRHGRGEVFHMISHYYLQRTELRERRHRQSAADFAAEKGVDASAVPDLAGLALGEVESAHSSARLFANIVATKKRAQRRATT